MTDEVWWASRDTDSNLVEIRDREPSMIRVGKAMYARGSGVGVFVIIGICDFESLSGTTIQPGECIAIRPLRIEIVKGK